MRAANVCVILMDDMGWKDITCAGSTFYETPNIDALRATGMAFGEAYAACPVCSPSRASMLTGQYPARHGVTDWIDQKGLSHPLKGRLIDAPYLKHIPDGARTLPAALKEVGYQTWHVGKWHLGSSEYWPERMGFDVNIGGCDWGHPLNGYFAPWGIPTLKEGAPGEHLTDRLTDEALRLIRERDKDRPFYLNMCYYDVHNPIQAKQEDIQYFEEKRRRLGLDAKTALIEGEAFHTLDKPGGHVVRRVVQSDAAYAAMILNLDRNVGRLVEAIREADENTVIVFTSDNGGLSTSEGSPTCNLPAREGKGWTTEGGLRVPMIVHWPGVIAAGSICDTPVTTPDLYPTILELAGASPKDNVIDGVSITPLFHGAPIEERPIFWHYPHYGNQGGTPGAAVRLGDYKLIEFFEDQHTELYDIRTDIGETMNLAAQFPDIAARLTQTLHAWYASVNAKMPMPNPDWPYKTQKELAD